MHLLRHDAKALSHGMGQRCFIALPGRAEAHRGIHRTRRLDSQPGRFVPRPRNAGRFVEARTIGGGLDHGTNTQTEIDTLLAPLLLALAEIVVVDGGQRTLQGFARRDVSQHLAGRHGVRQILRLQHVQSPHRHRIQFQRPRNRIHRAFHHPARDGHRRAHGAIAHLVAQHHLDVVAVVLHLVGAGQDHGHHAGQIVARVKAVGAEVLDDFQLQGQQTPLGADGGPGAAKVLPRLRGRQQVFQPVLAPAYRPLQVARHRRHRQFLPVQGDFLAEPAPDIGRNHADLRFRQAQAAGQGGAVGMGHLGPDMKRQVLAARIPDRDAAARLDRQMGLPVL